MIEFELGALLSERKNDLTKVGQMMARMPIDPRLARMLIGGAHFGVLKETLIIVSALAIQDPRERPADKQMQADQKHALFKKKQIQTFLFYLKLWNTLQTSPDTQSENKPSICTSTFLSWLRLREWKSKPINN